MTALVRLSLHHSKLIAVLALSFLALGAYWVRDMRVDVFPSLVPTQISIVTQAPGMVSEQVEQLVTRPVEYATLGADGVATVHSVSTQGISIVDVTLQRGSDAEKIRDALSARMTFANSDLPVGTGPAFLAPLASDTNDVMEIGITAFRLSSAQLRDVAQWTIRPRLLSTTGVATVAIYGGEVRRIEVRARSGDLADSDLGFSDVVDAVHRATSVQGAGFIDTPDQRILIEPHGQALTAKDVGAGQIHVAGGAPVRIGDVSDVSESSWPADNSALIDGRPGILLEIGSQLKTTVLGVTKNIDASLAPIKSALASQGISVNTDANRPADFIRHVVQQVALDLMIGALLIGILLVPLFRDFRAAMISFFSIPLALLMAVIFLKAVGWTFNIMTVGGLVVGLGLVADDAVLDVENVIADLRSAEIKRHSRARAILLASLEVRGPVIYATLIIIIALLPVVLLGNVAGALLAPLVTMIIVACLGAILIALTVTPALSLLFLSHLSPTPHPKWLSRLKDAYYVRLQRISERPQPYLVAAAVLLVVAFVVAAFFAINLLPPIHDGNLVVEYDAPTSTSLSVMQDYGVQITQALMRDPAIAHVYQRAGRPDFGSLALGTQHAEIDIALRPGLSMQDQDLAQRRVLGIITSFTGISAAVRRKLVSQTFGPQTDSTASVRILGQNLADIDRVSEQAAAVLRSVPKAGTVKIQNEGVGPVVRVDLNFQRLALYGLSSADVLSTIQTAFEGTRAARIFNNGRELDIAVTAEANVRRDPEAVGDLLIRSSQGISAPLRYIANVYLTDGRNAIEHDNGVRRQIVTFDPDSNAVMSAVRTEIAKRVKLPTGTYIEFSGAPNGGPPSSLILDALISTFAVLGLLYILYGDPRVTFFILCSTAFSITGGVAAVAMMGGVLSLGAFMGFVVLFGISARNAILLLSQIKLMLLRPQITWSSETVISVARERFSPILISAIVVAVGLTPITFQAGRAGMEILGPIVFVIMGGLCTSTLMSLFLSPALVLQFWQSTEFLPRRSQEVTE